MSETISDLSKAEKYLTDNNINYYNTHIPFVEEYRNFLYMLDKKYTIERVIQNKSVSKKDNHHIIKELVDRPRKITNIHLLPCKELSKLMFNEKIGFKSIEDKNKSDRDITKSIEALEKHYTEKKVWRILESSMIEVYGAGSIGIVNSYDELYGIQHIVYSADNILPIKIVNNEIEECVFVGSDTVNKDNTILQIHRRLSESNIEVNEDLSKPNRKTTIQKGYAITTIVIDKNGVVTATNETRSEVKQFIILKPFNIESIDYSRAFGKPIYWDYIDTIKSIDDIVNLADTDMKYSKRQIFINQNLVKNDDGSFTISNEYLGAFIIPFNDSQTNTTETDSFYKEYAPVPNTSIYDNALDNAIKRFSRDVGLGSDTLSINKMNAQTATATISENTEKFTTLKKHYEMMRDQFITLNQGILYLLKMNENIDVDFNIKIEFNTQDSVIEDDATLESRAISGINAGVMSVYSFLVDIRGLSGYNLTDELERLGLDKDGKKEVINMSGLENNLNNTVNDEIEKENKNNKEKQKAELVNVR